VCTQAQEACTRRQDCTRVRRNTASHAPNRNEKTAGTGARWHDRELLMDRRGLGVFWA
jgi:hypothetical protein